jgi:coenzyme F420-reducing hydrogenase gamma subunit
MEKGKNQNLSVIRESGTNDTKIRVAVGDCAVTLNFPTKPQDSAITEVKRMMLSGQGNSQK